MSFANAAPLQVDAQFFRLIQDQMEPIRNIRAEQQAKLQKDIETLSGQLAVLTKSQPIVAHVFSKTDMYRWREIFEVFIQG